MISLLDDVAILHYEDNIRLADSGKAVSNDEARSALHHLREGVLNLDLGSRIYRGSSLVQDKHRRQAEHYARNAEQLLLTLGKASAVLADDRVVSLRHSLDEAVRVGSLGGGDYLLVGGVRLAHDDIVADSSGFQPGFLKHHAVAFTQAAARYIPDIAALHADGTAVYVVEAHEQVDYRGLSAAGGTYDGNALTGLYCKAEVLDELSVRDIGEGHVVQLYAALYVGELYCVCRLLNLGLFLDEFKQARSAGKRILKLSDNSGDLVERLGVLIRIGKAAGELTYSERRRSTCGGNTHQRAAQRNSGVDNAVHESG